MHTSVPAPLRVALCLPSDLWNRLLAAALNQHAGIAAAPGAAAAWTPLPGMADGPAVLVTALPATRTGWERLAQWTRRGARARVLVLGENRPALAARALRAGASGYLDWESSIEMVVKAIRGVAAGELWAERKIAMALLREPEAERRLTPREQCVLEALAEGKRNKEIAAQLEISETTVKSHLNHAYQKLQISDRLQAALWVERHGLG
ncbi:MAG TPA: response regulator transcription factor [Terriglobales bacterium]|nr:response regulator transcription factor [Terriglobales bacterium]